MHVLSAEGKKIGVPVVTSIRKFSWHLPRHLNEIYLLNYFAPSRTVQATTKRPNSVCCIPAALHLKISQQILSAAFQRQTPNQLNNYSLFEQLWSPSPTFSRSCAVWSKPIYYCLFKVSFIEMTSQMFNTLHFGSVLKNSWVISIVSKIEWLIVIGFSNIRSFEISV